MRIKWKNVIIFVVILTFIGMLVGFLWAKYTAPSANKSPNIIKGAEIDHREEAKRVEQVLRKFFEQNPSWDPGESGQKLSANEVRVWQVDPKTKEISPAIKKMIEYLKKNNLYVSEATVDNIAKITFIEVGYNYPENQKKITDKIVFQGIADIAKNKLSNKPKLAIIVDDAGHSIDTLKKMLLVDVKLTFAILPDSNNATDSLQMIKDTSQQALLHQPMQPVANIPLEKNTITVNMSDAEIADILKRNLDLLPGVIGVNNHQGSKATSDDRVMRSVISVLKSRNMFFVDSNTIGTTVGDKIAGQMGVPTIKNYGFLDGNPDVNEIKKKFMQAAQSALKNGSAVYICHVRPATATALHEVIPAIKAMGVEFVYVSELVR